MTTKRSRAQRLGLAVGRGIHRVLFVVAAVMSGADGRNPSFMNPPPGPPPREYRP